MKTEIILPLETMTIAEKVDVIDRIMNDLSRNSSSVPVIEWHGNSLKEREQNLKNGTDRFMTIEDAEERIYEKNWP